MKKMTLLGGLTPAQFLRDYWHKKPLLIRQAIPGFTPVVSREALFALAAQPDVESRLVTHFDDAWKMDSGPFNRLPPIRKKDWTLLVQGVNLYDAKADALLRNFRFLPDARLDDLMISYATDTGGVGPHFDSYDVFLLQAQGRRRWRIGAQKDLSLADGLPLKILRNFEPDEEFTLEPGDMLYLPPHYAHDGIADGECMTYSIGFRAPSFQEIGEAFMEFMADSIALPGRVADPDLVPTPRPAEIGEAMLSQVSAELEKVRFDREDVLIFLGEYLSEPKSNVFFDEPDMPLSPARFFTAAGRRGVRLSLKTRMLYRRNHLFINGISLGVRSGDRKQLSALADQRELPAAGFMLLSADARETLHAWYADGWITVA